MQKFTTALLASAFAAASILAIFATSAQHPAFHSAGILSGAGLVAFADDHGNKDKDKDCINPAGNVRGWCKHKGDNENERNRHGVTFISGTVVGIAGNLATVRLDNGSIVRVNEQALLNRGTPLTVGQHVTLRGRFSGGVFVANGEFNGFRGPFAGQSVRGTIVSVNGSSVQIAQGLRLITINDSRALARGATNGSLFIGRTITAFGTWNGGVFFANRIQ